MVWYCWGKVSTGGVTGTSSTSTQSSQVQMTDAQRRFINTLAPAAQVVAKSSGILPSVMVAQAILESGWGNSTLAKQAKNYFGIKADASWKGKTITLPTTEVRNGVPRTENAVFRAYDSATASLLDYSKFFTSTPWRTQNYSQFRQARNYSDAVAALQKSGYATDPNYGNKLKSLIEKYRLQQYD